MFWVHAPLSTSIFLWCSRSKSTILWICNINFFFFFFFKVWWHAATLLIYFFHYWAVIQYLYILLVEHHSCYPHCIRSVEGLLQGCRAEIRTRACRTASRCATIWILINGTICLTSQTMLLFSVGDSIRKNEFGTIYRLVPTFTKIYTKTTTITWRDSLGLRFGINWMTYHGRNNAYDKQLF